MQNRESSTVPWSGNDDDVSRRQCQIAPGAAARDCGIEIEMKALRCAQNGDPAARRELGQSAGERQCIEYRSWPLEVVAARCLDLAEHRNLEAPDLAHDNRNVRIVDEH